MIERVEEFKMRTPEELLFLLRMKRERENQLFGAVTDPKKLKGRNPKAIRKMIKEIISEELDICTALEEKYGLMVKSNSKGELYLEEIKK